MRGVYRGKYRSNKHDPNAVWCPDPRPLTPPAPYCGHPVSQKNPHAVNLYDWSKLTRPRRKSW